MKKIAIWAWLAAALPGAVMDQSGKLGLGLRLGAPTGIDLKYWLCNKNALDFALGWGAGYWRNPYGDLDSRCYDNGFYNNNRGYCNAYRGDYYDYNDRYVYSSFHLHGDYLIHNFEVIKATFPIPLYYGPGLQYEYLRHYDSWLAVRGTVGLDFMPRNIPFDFFVEITPLFWFLPGPNFDIYGGAGARFWF
jgi:hypothetical protein